MAICENCCRLSKVDGEWGCIALDTVENVYDIMNGDVNWCPEYIEISDTTEDYVTRHNEHN